MRNVLYLSQLHQTEDSKVGGGEISQGKNMVLRKNRTTDKQEQMKG
jgi:hypothetical protein